MATRSAFEVVSAKLPAESLKTVTLFLAGDVMTGRGVDQVLPHPCDPQIYEAHATSAGDYVKLAEQANGPIERPMAFPEVWGDALAELDRMTPDARIINLETAVTQCADAEPEGINYRMSPENAGVITAAGIDCCVLANNHVLDWGRSGLLETLATLADADVTYAGAGQDDKSAEAPAILTIPGNARLLVFAFACPSAGAPPSWAAGPRKPGVNLVTRLSARGAGQSAGNSRGRQAAGPCPRVDSLGQQLGVRNTARADGLCSSASGVWPRGHCLRALLASLQRDRGLSWQAHTLWMRGLP